MDRSAAFAASSSQVRRAARARVYVHVRLLSRINPLLQNHVPSQLIGYLKHGMKLWRHHLIVNDNRAHPIDRLGAQLFAAIIEDHGIEGIGHVVGKIKKLLQNQVRLVGNRQAQE